MNELDLIAAREDHSAAAAAKTELSADQRRQKMIDRVAKLLRQAQDAAKGGRPEEESTYQVAAFELMAKYGIDEALAREHGEGLDKKVDPQADWIYLRMEGSYKPLQMDQLYGLAKAMHCTGYTTTGRRAIVNGQDVGVAIKMYGMKDHLDRLQMMWSLLQPQMMEGLKHAKPSYDLSDSGKLRIYRRNWARGFMNAVTERIRKAEYDAASGSGALVLYRRDLEVADKTMRMQTPGLRSASQSYRSDGSAYSAGRRAGQNASINHSIR